MERKTLFRLCHQCSELNEGEEEILRCGGCGKGFLPLNYFEKKGLNAERVFGGGDAEQASMPLPLNPIYGLIVFW